MQKAELDTLLKLTAIKLEPEQVPVFLEYFSSMKKMFDDFYEFEIPEENSQQQWLEKKYIQTFTEGEVFADTKAILKNVDSNRLVGNAIEMKSAFGE